MNAPDDDRPDVINERGDHAVFDYDGDAAYDEDEVYDDDEVYERVRPASPRRRRVLTVLGVLFLLIVLALGAAAFWVQREINPSGPPGEEIVLTVPAGSTTGDIGDLLTGEGVVANGTVWDWYVRYKGAGPFQAGEYTFRKSSAMGEAIAILDAGPIPPDVRRFTVPEGLTTREILDRLATGDKGLGFDRATMQQLLDSGQIRSRYQPADQPSSEGILFPDTYEVDDEADAAAVLVLLVSELDQTMDELAVTDKAAALGRSPYEILVIASLIEEESKVPEERTKIARVIYNRLEQGIALGIDATSRYEAEVAGRPREDLDFESESPYNTRRIPGIPPTPIAAPGRASIEAALNPEPGPWIYYVLADEEGNHVFTDSGSEFERAKQECREKGLGCG